MSKSKSVRFVSQRIAQLALLSAVGAALQMLEFPIFPVWSFINLNFCDLPALIAAFAFGPVEGLIVTVVRITVVFFVKGTATVGVGELALLIFGVSFVLPAGLIYKWKKTLKTAIFALAVSSVIFVAVSLPVNKYILFPAYKEFLFGSLGFDQRMLDIGIWTVILPNNLIKAVGTSLLTFFLYKPLSKALKWMPETKKQGKDFQSNSPEQTEKAAFEMAKKCKGGEVIVLQGEMGAGKTVFAKGFAKGLGVESIITSPTFTIHNPYQGRLKLHHFDFYRIEQREAETLGLDEFFNSPDGVCLVEWGENIKGLLPKDAKFVKISVTGESTRTISEVN